MNLISLSKLMLIKVLLEFIGLFSKEAKRHGKRILFLSSLNTALVKEGILDIGTLNVLDNNLQLLRSADNAGAIEMGKVLADDIWQKANIKQLLSANCNNQACDYLPLSVATSFSDVLIPIIPDWLRYDPATMRRDMVDLLVMHKVSLANA